LRLEAWKPFHYLRDPPCRSAAKIRLWRGPPCFNPLCILSDSAVSPFQTICVHRCPSVVPSSPSLRASVVNFSLSLRRFDVYCPFHPDLRRRLLRSGFPFLSVPVLSPCCSVALRVSIFSAFSAVNLVLRKRRRWRALNTPRTICESRIEQS